MRVYESEETALLQARKLAEERGRSYCVWRVSYYVSGDHRIRWDIFPAGTRCQRGSLLVQSVSPSKPAPRPVLSPVERCRRRLRRAFR